LFRPIKTDPVCDVLQVQVALINVSFTPLRQNPPKPQFVYVECSAISAVQHMARMAPIIKTLLVPINFDGGMYFSKDVDRPIYMPVAKSLNPIESIPIRLLNSDYEPLALAPDSISRATLHFTIDVPN